MKDIRALDVKVFDTRKYTTPQKAFEEQAQAYFEGLLWIYPPLQQPLFVAFPYAQQILKEIHHNDAIVEGVSGILSVTDYSRKRLLCIYTVFACRTKIHTTGAYIH